MNTLNMTVIIINLFYAFFCNDLSIFSIARKPLDFASNDLNAKQISVLNDHQW